MKLPSFMKQICRICDATSGRHALRGVRLESSAGVSAVTATDGRRLVSVSYPDEDGAAIDTIVDSKGLARCWSTVAGRGDATFDGSGIRGVNAQADLVPIDGNFPRYEDVFRVNGDSGYVAVRVDPALLKDLCDVYASAQSADKRGMVMWVKDADSAVFLSQTDGKRVVRAALMPLTAEEDDTAFPAPASNGQPAASPSSSAAEKPQASPPGASAVEEQPQPQQIDSATEPEAAVDEPCCIPPVE